MVSHKYVLYFCFKIAQFLVLVSIFPVKCCLAQHGLPNLCGVCIGLPLLTGLSTFLTAIIAVLVVSVATCIIATLCSVQLSFFVSFTETALFESACFLYLVCLG